MLTEFELQFARTPPRMNVSNAFWVCFGDGNIIVSRVEFPSLNPIFMEFMYAGMWQIFFEIDTEGFVPRSLAKYVLPLLGIPTKNDIFIIYIIH